MEFSYNLPVNLLFGRGKVNVVGKEAAAWGKKALIVTGRSSTKKSGLLDKVSSLLKDAGLTYEIFDRVEPNPTAASAYAGAQLAQETNCDVVVGLGGGSIMDCAKAIAFIACNEGDVFDYIFGTKTGSSALPLVLVPTTCGTGSEGNGFAVLTNEKNCDKKSLRTNLIVAKASIIDPELMTTMPKETFASVGFDALCHCMEAYLSRACQPLVEMQALDGIARISRSFLNVYNDYSDMEGWANVSFASTLGGMCINMAGITAPHGIEHPASGLRNIVHGHGLAALTPVIYRESISYAPEKFAKISQLLGGTGAGDCVETIERLLDSINMRKTLGQLGVLESDIDWMTENSFKISLGGINAHPRVFTKEEIRDLYYKAL